MYAQTEQKNMHKMLTVFRWFTASILTLLLLLLLFFGTAITGISKTIANPEHIKSYIAHSGIYDDAVPVILHFFIQSFQKAGEGEKYFSDIQGRIINPKDPFGQMIQEVLRPEFLRQSVDTIIDASFAWLRGETEKPEFEIVFAKDKQTMQRFLSVLFTEKIRALPACSNDFILTKNFDPFNATCRPAGFRLEYIDTFLMQNSDRPEFDALMQKATINSTNLVIDPKTSQKAQLAYNIIAYSWPLLFVTLALLSLLIAASIPKKWHGLRLSGITMAIAGSILCVALLIFVSLQNIFVTFFINRLPDTADFVQTYIASIIREAYADSLSRIGFESLCIVAWGIILIAIDAKLRKNTLTHSA